MNSLAERSGIKCPDKWATKLEAEGYVCFEKFFQFGQWHYCFERDPWEATLIIAIGDRTTAFEDYCASGNVEAIA